MACLRLGYSTLFAFMISMAPITVASNIWMLELQGAVGPATADYLIRGIEEAELDQADLLIIEMDTPGGLDTAMRQIIKAIIGAKIPVASYVSPSGSRAASAGTYILYASHIAAMAPATNLGAATPVQIGPSSLPKPKPTIKPENDGETKESTSPPPRAMQKKIINDAIAYIQGLANLHGRNALWAEKAVREAASLSAAEALKKNVIDIVADDIDDLLQQAHDREVKVIGKVVKLDLHAPQFSHYKPDWRTEFLSVITNPNVAYILMMMGIYGLLLEAYNPGTWVAGIVGAVSLLLAMYAFQLLPVSYAGLALIVLGMMLMIIETFVPSFGILGLGGISAFIIGSIILFDTDLPAYQIALPLIITLALFSAAIVLLILGMIVRARKKKVVSGLSTLINQVAVVEIQANQKAMVLLQGERWPIHCESTLQAGDEVRIIAANGITLEAEKLQEKT